MRIQKNIISNITFLIVIILISLVLAINYLFVLNKCSSYFDDQILTYSEQLTEKNSLNINNTVNYSLDIVKKISSQISNVSGFQAIDSAGEKYVSEYNIACLQFLYEGNASFRYGKGVGSSTSEEYKDLVGKGKFDCSHIMTDESLGVQCVAMYGPVTGNSEIDGVIAYFQVKDLFNLKPQNNSKVLFQCVANKTGDIIQLYSDKNFPKNNSHNIYTYLTNLNHTKAPIENLKEYAEKSISGSYKFASENKNYVVSTINISSISADYMLYNIYNESDLSEDKFPLYGLIYSSGILILLFCGLLLIIYIIGNIKNKALITKIDQVDPLIGCNTYSKFIEEAKEILYRNKISKYSIVYFDINKFAFIRDNFGSTVSTEILKNVSTIISKILSSNETYGHIVDDRFASLMHWSTIDELTNRIRIISALIENNQLTKENSFTLSTAIGIYNIDRSKNYSIQQMVDRATIAQNLQKQNPSEPYKIYDSNIRSAYLKEAEIETRMENSLQNNEFKVFYQPKYNISKNCIDGAEALVRWYQKSTNTFTNPDEFVPLFEINGFISKVDRYIFKSVCQYISECIDRNETIIPISVNISRVTATKYDFLSYYISTKNQYKIPPDILMLEFTESFAYENYSIINNIVTELKKNGFKCSIDDFGSGYSSFEILKKLDMDELKLDKLFLDRSNNVEKDNILLKTIIKLGNDFNMKVTQEGVENINQVKQLKAYGCNVIQGYYYSKPLPQSDFMEFINSKNTINV